jgi:hypothetical protein
MCIGRKFSEIVNNLFLSYALTRDCIPYRPGTSPEIPRS